MQTEGPRVKVPKGQKTEDLRHKVSRIAEEDTAASKPFERILDRVSADTPAVAAVPEHVHSTKNTGGVPNVEDVGIAVVYQQYTFFSIRLLFEQVVEFCKSSFSFRLTTKLFDDRAISGNLDQVSVTELLFTQGFFSLAVASKEPVGKVVPNSVKVEFDFFGILGELVLGDEFLRRGRGFGGAEPVQDRILGCEFSIHLISLFEFRFSLSLNHC